MSDMSICPACGEEGPRFAPPSFGEDGFYICQQERTTFDSDALLANAHAHDVQQTESVRLQRIVEAARNLLEARTFLNAAMMSHGYTEGADRLNRLFALVDAEP